MAGARRRPAAVAMMIAAVLTGCGGEGAVSGSGGSGGGGPSDPLAACGAEELCPVVSITVTCPAPLQCPAAECSSTVDTGIAKCFLQKLRDREVGVLRFSESTSGYCGESTTIVSFGDGTVSVQRSTFEDLAHEDFAPVSRSVQPDTFFNGCLTLNDEKKLIGCVKEAASLPTEGGKACPCSTCPP
jgi:hypothetical protein